MTEFNSCIQYFMQTSAYDDTTGEYDKNINSVY